ncbi:hypothetical protein F5Y15DRAFT_421331 [Xylariaceae sp. FL0016]|nr:hypothetical protein F5Y15DRAFT_421331 [Xylariaceae sp. FL0016]
MPSTSPVASPIPILQPKARRTNSMINFFENGASPSLSPSDTNLPHHTTTPFTGDHRIPFQERMRLMRWNVRGESSSPSPSPIPRPSTPIPSASASPLSSNLPSTPWQGPNLASVGESVPEPEPLCPGAPRKPTAFVDRRWSGIQGTRPTISRKGKVHDLRGLSHGGSSSSSSSISSGGGDIDSEYEDILYDRRAITHAAGIRKSSYLSSGASGKSVSAPENASPLRKSWDAEHMSALYSELEDLLDVELADADDERSD